MEKNTHYVDNRQGKTISSARLSEGARYTRKGDEVGFSVLLLIHIVSSETFTFSFVAWRTFGGAVTATKDRK